MTRRRPALLDNDEQWFAQWPTRRCRIRPAIGSEQAAAFMSLGPHDERRRRIIVYRAPLPATVPATRKFMLMRIPFLPFADEEIANEDAILLPILHGIMVDHAKKYGIDPGKLKEFSL